MTLSAIAPDAARFRLAAGARGANHQTGNHPEIFETRPGARAEMIIRVFSKHPRLHTRSN